MTENLLRHETSPYLLQHADNPVHWHPWSREAFERAEREEKPVFLSVGYSSCHWCHVMAHESFEHPEVAEILNRHFVCIKVDREERPDIDGLYMLATQVLTGRGGWPNSVFLLPDQRPFYAGTYWPREDRGGYAGFTTLLRNLAGLWGNRRGEIENQAGRITERLRMAERAPPPGEIEDKAPFVSLCAELRETFDEANGGFGGAPKFPPHQTLLTLLSREGTPETDTWVRRTLDAMALGGIRDQVGGAFHRYATDGHWFLPHFEIMLYDNAQLAEIYALAAERYDEETYRRVCRGICDAMLRDFQLPEGGFASAWDADSPEGEGSYYMWRASEIDTLLGERATAFKKFFHIRPDGNANDEATGRPTGRNLLVPERFPLPEWERELSVLMEHRRRHRTPPLRDDKVITAWNGLMIRGLSVAGRVLNEPRYLDAAREAARFVVENNRLEDGRLARTWREGRARYRAVLEDYTFLAHGLATLEERKWRQTAKELMDLVEESFKDETGGYFLTAHDTEPLLIRRHDPFDNATPSPVGMAIQTWKVLDKPDIVTRLQSTNAHAINQSIYATQTLWR